LPAEQKLVQLKVSVAAGPWKKVADVQPLAMAGVAKGKNSVVLSAAFDGAGAGLVILSHNYVGHSTRVVAYDKQGKLHASAGESGVGAGQLSQKRVEFPGLKREHIDRFEFQIREYEIVELEGLPIEPLAVDDKPR